MKVRKALNALQGELRKNKPRHSLSFEAVVRWGVPKAVRSEHAMLGMDKADLDKFARVIAAIHADLSFEHLDGRRFEDARDKDLEQMLWASACRMIVDRSFNEAARFI